MTVSSLTDAMIARGLSPARLMYLCDSTHVGARNAAAREAINCGAEWLLFIDSDMDFPPDTLPRLKRVNADIASLDMWTRSIPSFRMILRAAELNEEGKRRLAPVEPIEIGRDENGKPKYGVQDADVVGMACTLIKVSLLKRMEPPWFFMVEHGEDATFCFIAKQKYGATIKCDFGAVAGHWGVVRMSGDDWSRDAKNQPMKIDQPEMLRDMGAKNVRE